MWQGIDENCDITNDATQQCYARGSSRHIVSVDTYPSELDTFSMQTQPEGYDSFNIDSHGLLFRFCIDKYKNC